MGEPDPRAPGPTKTGATETSSIAPRIPAALPNLPPAVCTYQAAGQPALAQPRPGVPLVMPKEAHLSARVATGFRIDLVKPIDCRARNGCCPPSNRDARAPTTDFVDGMGRLELNP